MGGLLGVRTRGEGREVMATVETSEPLLQVTDLEQHFPVRRGILQRVAGHVHAVNGVTFHINRGETLGLVGESGCGKSTVGRTIVRLYEPSGGSICLNGREIAYLSRRQMHPIRRQLQIIFQDPYTSLNPRMSAGAIVGEPMVIHGLAAGSERRRKVAALFERVGLRPQHMDHYPHELSGGQCQRLAIARTLAVEPDIIVADESVSALDVSIQASIINLLLDLQRDLGLSLLFISHDMSVIEHVSHRVAVMYLGHIVEIGTRDEVLGAPRHPYTEALLSAVPTPKPQGKRRERILLKGEVPSPISPPSGCPFHTRCPLAEARCRQELPLLRELWPGHQVACHVRGPAEPAIATEPQ